MSNKWEKILQLGGAKGIALYFYFTEDMVQASIWAATVIILFAIYSARTYDI